MAKPSRIRLPCIAVVVLLSLNTMASQVGDSLRFVLEADAGPVERAAALLRLARRRATADPVGTSALLEEATRLARQAGDSALVHEALVALSDVKLRLGQRADHMRTSMQALRIAKHLGLAEWIALDLQSIARAYRLREEPERAIGEARSSLAIAKKAGSRRVMQCAELLLLESLIDAGRHEEAHRMAAASLDDGALDPTHRARLQVVLAKLLLHAGRPFDARPLLKAAEHLLLNADDRDGVLEAKVVLCQTAIAMGNRVEASSLIAALQEELPNSPALWVTLARLNHDLAVASGDHKAAHGLLIKLCAMEDSCRKVDRDLLLSGMHALYDMDLKVQDNDDLRVVNMRHEADLAAATRTKSLLIGAASALAALTATLVWLLLRNRLSARRSHRKSVVIARQRDALEAKHLELERQNLRLREALLHGEQKDLIIKEIHHRVKNNLQVIDGLLVLHLGTSNDPSAQKVIRDARGSISAMALVHAAIHQHGGEEALPLMSHFADLARLVLVAHGRHDSISARVQAEGVHMHADQLLPLSLLVNELLTNSIKHSFPIGAHGAISLSVTRAGAGWILRYADDGRPPVDGMTRSGSIGMNLIRGLADQLDGELEMDFSKGTQVRLRLGHVGSEVVRLAS
jgi:two-component sensor histidine kinase